MLKSLLYLQLLHVFITIVFADAIGGKAVFVQDSNSIWIFSAARSSQSGNTLYSIDITQSFNTLNPPLKDYSKDIRNEQCPILHFAHSFPSADHIGINVFGVPDNSSNKTGSHMTMCHYNTRTAAWNEVMSLNAPEGRRNFAAANTRSGQVVFWGGDSDLLTGFTQNVFVWRSDVSFWDSLNGWIAGWSLPSSPSRANATMTQIADTNGQLAIIGGANTPPTLTVDEVTNVELANMSDIMLFDPRSQSWTTVYTTGVAPTKRKHHSAVLHPDGRNIIVFGGEGFNVNYVPYLLNDVALLDTKTWRWWTPNTTGLGLYRSNHSAIVVNNQMWVVAGTNATDKAVDIQILDLDTWTWSFEAKSNNQEPYAAVGGVSGVVGISLSLTLVALLTIAYLCWRYLWHRKRPSPILTGVQAPRKTLETTQSSLSSKISDDLLQISQFNTNSSDKMRPYHIPFSSSSPNQSYIDTPWNSTVNPKPMSQRNSSYVLLPIYTQKPNLVDQQLTTPYQSCSKPDTPT